MNNKEKLAHTISGRITKATRASIPTTVELGIINDDLSLSVDSIQGTISPDEYMINLIFSHENYCSYTEMNSSQNAPHHHEGGSHAQYVGSGYHTHDDGLHDHRAPSCLRRLEPKDRVLVMWAGFEPIIISIVVPGNSITKN